MSNQRLKQLMKELNIPPLKIPKPIDPVILSGVEDPLLPKEIADELSSRDDIVEIAYFPPFKNWKGQFRVTFKKNEHFSFCRFYV